MKHDSHIIFALQANKGLIVDSADMLGMTIKELLSRLDNSPALEKARIEANTRKRLVKPQGLKPSTEWAHIQRWRMKS